MAEDGYNGWKNYETWCVNLWLDNDETTYNEVRALVEENRGEARCDIADALCEYVTWLPETAQVLDGPASFVCDLLNAALSEVDWLEIAESILSELPPLATNEEVDA